MRSIRSVDGGNQSFNGMLVRAEHSQRDTGPESVPQYMAAMRVSGIRLTIASSISRWFWLRGRTILGYVGSVLSVGIALFLTNRFPPLQSVPTVLFTAAIVATAWLGGRGPAILSIVFSALAVDYFFLLPVGSVLSNATEILCVLTFTLVGSAICYLQQHNQRIAMELTQANESLELRVQLRTEALSAANASLLEEIAQRRRAQAATARSEAKLRDAVEVTEAALKEKVVLLRELQHRVKNNLQIISSLLSLQGSRIEDRSDRERFKECQQRVHAIALVHERLYRTPTAAGIDLANFFDDLVQRLLRCYCINTGDVVPWIAVESGVLGIDQVIPCALIVNELVCNSLKHAFPDGRRGKIRVELGKCNGQIRLTVSDDGVGMLARSPRENGVGRKIVHALVDQLSGTLDWTNDRGTTVTVTFPESK